MGELFESANGDFDLQKKHINGNGDYVITAGLANNGIMGKTDIDARVFDKNTITIDMFGAVFYRNFQYKMVTHARVFSLKPKFEITEKQGLFLANSFHSLSKKFGYDNMCSWTKIKDTNIQLPSRNNTPDFDFMDAFIAELQKENKQKLKSYLAQNGLLDCTLTDKERLALEAYNNVQWGMFNLKKLFGASTRGRRLKSLDRISGNLPFVTAGEADEGVSAFIGNNVIVFPENTTTIDMFGSAKYRNYKYGADDHIAVVHTQDLSKYASIFITQAIHKVSYTGDFHYGRNFYAKDADELNINLPVKPNNTPDFDFMDTLISAVHKLMVKNVVRYVEKV